MWETFGKALNSLTSNNNEVLRGIHKPHFKQNFRKVINEEIKAEKQTSKSKEFFDIVSCRKQTYLGSVIEIDNHE